MAQAPLVPLQGSEVDTQGLDSYTSEMTTLPEARNAVQKRINYLSELVDSLYEDENKAMIRYEIQGLAYALEALAEKPSKIAIEEKIKAEKHEESKKKCGSCHKPFAKGTDVRNLKMTVEGYVPTYYHDGECWDKLWD